MGRAVKRVTSRVLVIFVSAVVLVASLGMLAEPCFAAQKLIALTFDDGPRPYVLYGVKQPGAASGATPGLLDVLDRNGVKATFFYMGWRLTPKTWERLRMKPTLA